MQTGGGHRTWANIECPRMHVGNRTPVCGLTNQRFIGHLTALNKSVNYVPAYSLSFYYENEDIYYVSCKCIELQLRKSILYIYVKE